jgi:hypothetical protein
MRRRLSPLGAILDHLCFDERFVVSRYPVTHVFGVLVTTAFTTNRHTLICNLI